MAENKVATTLRKVIINFVPEEYAGKPISEGVIKQIDISDKLENGKYYCLYSVQAKYDTHESEITYIPFEDYNQFKIEVENILDATIVNAKQRESVQRLLDQAFYGRGQYGGAVI